MTLTAEAHLRVAVGHFLLEEQTINIIIIIIIIIIITIIIIQFFINYVPSQQLQGQLQTQHSVVTSNYIMDKHKIKSKTNYRQALERKNINAEKQTNKQMK
jgi:hypothetical protein